MSESALVTACVRELDRRGAWHTNLHPDVGRVGLPDRAATYKGRSLLLEFKAPKGRLRPLQEYELVRARRAGAIAEVIRSVEQLRAILDDIDAGRRALPGPQDDAEPTSADRLRAIVRRTP